MIQRIVAFSIVVTAAAWALAGFGLSTNREAALKHAELNGLNLARAFAQNTQRVFTAIDQTLLHLRDDYQASRGKFSLRAWRQQWPYTPEPILDLAIIDNQGTVIDRDLAGVKQIAADDNLAFHRANAGDASY